MTIGGDQVADQAALVVFETGLFTIRAGDGFEQIALVKLAVLAVAFGITIGGDTGFAVVMETGDSEHGVLPADFMLDLIEADLRGCGSYVVSLFSV